MTIKNKHNKDKFNIRKDSTIGQYLINNFDQDYIINEDEYIYYVKAVPKIKVSQSEHNVTNIKPEGEEESFEMPTEEL